MLKVDIPNTLLDESSNKTIISTLHLMRNFVEIYKPNLPLGSKSEIEIYIDADLEVNAYAYLRENKYGMAINFGLVLWAMQVASNFTCEASKSADELDGIASDLSYTQHDMDIYKYGICQDEFEAIQVYNRFKSPVDTNNIPFFIQMASSMMLLILFHEYAHIVRGHINILKTISKSSEFTLHDDFTGDLLDNPDLIRALEYDADHWASHIVVLYAYSKHKSLPALGGKKRARSVMTIMVLCQSLICGYRYFRNKKNSYRSSYYPSQMQRFAIFITATMEALSERMSKKRVSEVIETGLMLSRGMENVFEEMKEMTDIVNMSDTLTYEFEELNKILDKYSLIVDELGFLSLVKSNNDRI